MKIQLNETQINRLIKGYKTTLINEQNNNGFNPEVREETVNFSGVWSSGKWKLTSSQISAIEPELKRLTSFIVKNPSSKLIIQIESGESKVTNYDREQSGTVKVKPGYLSQKRGEQLATFINNYFSNILSKGVIKEIPSIPKPKTIIGASSYDPKVDKANDPKYSEEQFVRLKIKATATYECLIGMNLTVAYIKGKGPKHECDEALFNLKLNGVPLGIANLNNGTKDLAKPRSRVEFYMKRYNENLIEPLADKEFDKEKPKMDAAIRERKSYEYNGKDMDYYKEFAKTNKLFNWKIAVKKEIENNLLSTTEGLLKYNPEEEFTLDLYKKITSKVGGSNESLKPTIGKKMSGSTPLFDMIKKLSNLENRTTDNERGGTRTQTFVIDTNKAKAIVQQSGKTDKKLVLTIQPLVDKTGPYKMFYKSGAHAEVPFVKIESKSGEVRYSGLPNSKLKRGSTEEVVLLVTDLCGNPIT